MKFRENEKSEQWIQFLQQYIFDKNYDHDIVDLVLKALSNIYIYIYICIKYLYLKTQLTILLMEILEKNLPIE